MKKLKEKKISIKQGMLLLAILYILFVIILIAVSKSKTKQSVNESGKTVTATESIIKTEISTAEEQNSSNSETAASTMSEKEYEDFIEKLKEEMVTASPNESDEGQ